MKSRTLGEDLQSLPDRKSTPNLPTKIILAKIR